MSINEHTIHAALKELYKGTGMEITAADVQAGIEAMTAVRDKWLERNWEKVTRTVRIEGVEVVMPIAQLADPDPNGPQECPAQEPYWPDGGGGAVCTLRAHPARSAHVAHDGDGVVAIWGGRAPAPAEPHDMVGECGVCGGPVYHSRGCKNAVEDGWVEPEEC